MKDLALKTPALKKPDVKIISINTILVPNSVGSFGIVTVGLGDDSMCYNWNSQNKTWQES